MADNEIRAVDEPLPDSSKAPTLYILAIAALFTGIVLQMVLPSVLSWAGKAIPAVLDNGNIGMVCATALATLVGYKAGQAQR